MRKSIIMAVCLLSLAACSKKNNGNPSNPTGTAPNSVTVNVDGKSYTVTGDATGSGNRNEVEVSTYQTTGKDAFILIRVYKGNNSTVIPDFEMHLESEKGNSSGIGTYPLKIYNEYTEHYGKQIVYGGTFPGSITVTKNDIGKSIQGTFDMTIDDGNGNGPKKVTGSFSATSF